MWLYPAARMGSDADDYHGEPVGDPYRWLEATGDPEVAGWIKAQNELTESFLAAIPARQAIRARLTELWDYPKARAPFERGGRWFQLRNPGLAAQPVLYVMDAPDAHGRPLLDPNGLSEDGTVAVGEISVSNDGALLAYATSHMGSDWQSWHVRDIASGADTGDLVEWSKFSGAAGGRTDRVSTTAACSQRPGAPSISRRTSRCGSSSTASAPSSAPTSLPTLRPSRTGFRSRRSATTAGT